MIEPQTVQSVSDELPPRNIGRSLKRGFACRCPACGKGAVFNGYLKVVPACAACGEDLTPQRADDAPPYFTIVVVGHIVVPLVLMVETAWAPSMLLQMLLWVPLTIVLTLALLRPIKGAVVGYQWATYMDGFDPRAEPDFPLASPVPTPR